MAIVPVGLDRLKSQLLTSGLSQKDPVLYQVINQLIDYLRQSNIALGERITSSSGGGSNGSGITQLTGDVLAGPGSGSQITTIAANAITTNKIANSNVTLQKIQDIEASRLLGRDNSGPGIVQELTVGQNLIIQNGQLDIELPGGSGNTGIAHNLLSPTHPDTIPASPIKGDLIFAGDAVNPEGTFVNAVLVGNLTEDFEGIRAAYMLGFNHQELLPGIVGWGAPPPLNMIIPEPAKQWLTWDFIDAFLQSSVIDDFVGIRGTMIAGNFGAGIGWAYTAYPVDIIPAPDPATLIAEGQWQRLPKGNNGQVLSIVDGTPQWALGYELPNPLVISDLEVTNLLEVTGLGNASFENGLSEYNRSEKLGDWLDIPYDANDFTAAGGTSPTWTVGLADLLRFQYKLEGNSVTLAVAISASTVGGTAPTELQIRVPFTFIGFMQKGTIMQENITATSDNYVGYDAAVNDTRIFIRKFPVGGGGVFDTTADGCYIGFEITAELA